MSLNHTVQTRGDLITGNGLLSECDRMRVPYSKTDFIASLETDGSVFVTHNGGFDVRPAPPGMACLSSPGASWFFRLGDDVRWFCQNNLSRRSLTEGLPLGIENWGMPDVAPERRRHYTIGSGEDNASGRKVADAIIDVRRGGGGGNAQRRSTVLVAWRQDTAPYERGLARAFLARHRWVEVVDADVGSSSRMEPADYVRRIAAVKFCACPRGNGEDTHRVWEALYAGCCPIVVRSPHWDAMSLLYPIWVVDSWAEVSPASMDARWRAFRDSIGSLDVQHRLTLKYWANRIFEAVEGDRYARSK